MAVETRQAARRLAARVWGAARGWGGYRGYRWAALGLIVAGALLRLGLALAGWPATDSDEATMGLMARHIAAGHDFPLFFYGQSYMGTLQAYVGALYFMPLGPSVLALRLGLITLYGLFMLVMAALVRPLYGRAYALVALAVLALGGGPDLLKAQLLALGGYPETLFFGALALLLAVWLTITPAASGRPRGRRLAAWVGLGLVMGLGWWSDPLVLPFLLAAALPLAIYRWREARWWGLGAAVAGLVVGLAPQLAFPFTSAGRLRDSGPSAVAAFLPHGAASLATLPARLLIQITGALVVALPNATGAGWACTVDFNATNPLADWASAGAAGCVAGRLAWSAALLALAVVAWRAAWRAWRAARRDSDGGAEADVERAGAIQAGRLALLVGGGLALALYTISPQAAGPLGNVRYLIGLLIALPAALYPLWRAARARRSGRTLGAWAGLALLLVALAGGMAAAYAESGETRARNNASQTLANDLERLGVRHMYTDYWTCDRTAFLSDERITCAALNTRMGVAQDNRYQPYVIATQADPRAAYVFPSASAQALALTRRARTDPDWRYTLTRMDGYDIWLARG